MKGAGDETQATSSVRPFLRFGKSAPAASEQLPASSPVGTLLCATRMRLGKDLQRVAEVLHIRYNFLVAIEDGRYEDLPGQAYAIGFVRAYADHLGLDGDEIVRRYKDDSAGLKRRATFEFPLPAPDSGIPSGALLLAAVILGMLTYGIWYSLAGSDRSAVQVIQEVPDRLVAALRADVAQVATSGEGAVATTPPVSGEAFDDPDTQPPEPVTTAPEAEVAALTPPAPTADSAAVVQLRAKADLWITLRENQKADRTQFLRKDELYPVADARAVTLLTGSGKDLEILVDGKVMPAPDQGLFTRGVALDPQRLQPAAGTRPAP